LLGSLAVVLGGLVLSMLLVELEEEVPESAFAGISFFLPCSIEILLSKSGVAEKIKKKREKGKD
jgi:hypothetical protein